jgi:hypothetical protein
MAFAGIFQPFARLRWIRFGLLMRDRKFSRRFSVLQTTAKYFAEWVKDAAGLERVMREVMQMTKLDLAKVQKAFAGK